MHGQIVYVDRFGNLATNIAAALFPAGARVDTVARASRIVPVSQTYGAVPRASWSRSSTASGCSRSPNATAARTTRSRAMPGRRSHHSLEGASMSDRPSWDQYFMTITRQVAERSTCTRAKVARSSCATRTSWRPATTARPAGLPHCLDVGCLIYRRRRRPARSRRTASAPSTPRSTPSRRRRRTAPRIRDADDLHHPHALHPLLQGADQHRHHAHLLRARVQAAHARGDAAAHRRDAARVIV